MKLELKRIVLGILEELSKWNCVTNHPYSKLTRPVCKRYTCLVCMREFEAPYD